MSQNISVIIPAYNAEQYVAKSIRSALDQDGRTKEVIVVDDASTDNTLDIIQGFSDPRVRVLTNEENRRQAFSRNRAIEAARGKWIALLDADDWFEQGRLDHLLRIARRHNADMVADDMHLVFDEATHPHTTHLRRAHRSLQEQYVLDPIFFIKSARAGLSCLRFGPLKPIIRSAFLEQNRIRYHENMFVAEDFGMYLKCLVRGAHFVVDTEPRYYRRLRNDSLTGGDAMTHLQNLQHDASVLLEDPLFDGRPSILTALQERRESIERRLAFKRLQHAWRERGAYEALSMLPSHKRAALYVRDKLVDDARCLFFQMTHSSDGYNPSDVH